MVCGLLGAERFCSLTAPQFCRLSYKWSTFLICQKTFQTPFTPTPCCCYYRYRCTAPFQSVISLFLLYNFYVYTSQLWFETFSDKYPVVQECDTCSFTTFSVSKSISQPSVLLTSIRKRECYTFLFILTIYYHHKPQITVGRESLCNAEYVCDLQQVRPNL